MALKIEKGIPIPEIRHTIDFKETIRKMKKGDSFVLPHPKTTKNLYTFAKEFGITVITRSVKGGIRIWRIK